MAKKAIGRVFQNITLVKVRRHTMTKSAQSASVKFHTGLGWKLISKEAKYDKVAGTWWVEYKAPKQDLMC
jgi:hypothetical protein